MTTDQQKLWDAEEMPDYFRHLAKLRAAFIAADDAERESRQKHTIARRAKEKAQAELLEATDPQQWETPLERYARSQKNGDNGQSRASGDGEPASSLAGPDGAPATYADGSPNPGGTPVGDTSKETGAKAKRGRKK